MHRMIPVKEIARTLGLAEDYLVALCEQGRLPAQKIDDAWVMWEDDMDAARRAALAPPRAMPMDDDPF